jgi:hypothetical protein
MIQYLENDGLLVVMASEYVESSTACYIPLSPQALTDLQAAIYANPQANQDRRHLPHHVLGGCLGRFNYTVDANTGIYGGLSSRDREYLKHHPAAAKKKAYPIATHCYVLPLRSLLGRRHDTSTDPQVTNAAAKAAIATMMATATTPVAGSASALLPSHVYYNDWLCIHHALPPSIRIDRVTATIV